MQHITGADEQPFGKRVGGWLSLDFVNTVAARVSRGSDAGKRDWLTGLKGERLDSYRSLVAWATQAGALAAAEGNVLLREASHRPARAEKVHARALETREAMYRVYKAAIEGWKVPPQDLDKLNREILLARQRERLVAEPDFVWTWEHDPAALDRPLWPVVLSVSELLTASALTRVRQCPGDDCGWLFLDTSRSGRRRWCDMSDCGNAAKVRRFRDRARASEG